MIATARRITCTSIGHTRSHTLAIQYTAATAAVTANQIYFHWTHKLVPVDCCAELRLPRLCCLLCVLVVEFTSMVRYLNTGYVSTFFFGLIFKSSDKEHFSNCQLKWRFLDSSPLILPKIPWIKFTFSNSIRSRDVIMRLSADSCVRMLLVHTFCFFLLSFHRKPWTSF